MYTFGFRPDRTVTHVYIDTALTLTAEIAAETGVHLTTEQRSVNLTTDCTINGLTVDQSSNLTIEQVSHNG